MPECRGAFGEVPVHRVDGDDVLAIARELGADLVQGLAVSEPVAKADLWPRLDRTGP